MSPFFGLSAFPVTPLKNAAVDLGHFQRLVEGVAIEGVASIGALGSTGLYPYLPLSERRRAYRAAVEAAAGTPVLAGIGAYTTEDVIASARAAEEAGAAGLLLAPVQYLPLSDDEIVGLFEDTARATDLPVLIYNNPGTTGRNMDEALLLRLASLPGVEGAKMPSAATGGVKAQIDRLRPALGADFSLGYSGDATIMDALLAGADAWYSVLAGTCPDFAVEIWRARDDAAALARLNHCAAPLWELFRRHGGIRVVYALLGLPLPRPLGPLSDADIEAVHVASQALEDFREGV